MKRDEALDLAIELIRQKSECDRLIVRMSQIYPQHADRHAKLRLKRFDKAIEVLQGLRRERVN